MKEKRKALWIEDGARFDLPYLAAPIYMDGQYDLIVAENVADSISQLQSKEFDAIIVDIRLPPGDDPEWAGLYKEAGYDKVAARLGLKLLYSILGSPDAEVKLEHRPSWITADKIGILTVESRAEMENDLKRLDIQVFRQKQAGIPETVLLDIIRLVLQQQM